MIAAEFMERSVLRGRLRPVRNEWRLWAPASSQAVAAQEAAGTIIYPSRIRGRLNLKTAKALGLTIPPSLLALAHEVIE
jgi:hypothetical protein